MVHSRYYRQQKVMIYIKTGRLLIRKMNLHHNFGSGAVPCNILLLRIIENNKLMLILKQVRLSKS